MQTPSIRKQDLDRKWFVIDAANQPLGRLASRIATVLRGKHTAQFTPHVDTGDFIVVVNAEQIKLTGAKLVDKKYYRHSGYPGGFRAEPYGSLLQRRPDFVIEKAVRGMLPKNRLGRQMAKKLKVYAGASHPHQAQNPQPMSV